jgi:ABC-type transport system involved in multi-copper enzyme maturation permease subunit
LLKEAEDRKLEGQNESARSRELAMPLLVESCAAWVGRTLSWSAGRAAWQESFAALLLLAWAGVTAWQGGRLSWPLQAALWAVLPVALAVLLRRGGLKLFGPVLAYDLVRTARRKQQAALRSCYGSCLLAVFFFLYLTWVFSRNVALRDLFDGITLEPHTLANFTSSFFLAFLAVQFLAACLLTPAWTAGAITEEKESRTLEFLLSTDLHNREIVLSLAVSRLANLALVILTGLPVLGLLQFLGGIDPNLVLAGFGVTALTMVSLTGLGIVVSVYAYHPRQAILRTYGWAAAYLAASGAGWLLLLPVLGWSSFPSSSGWTSPLTVQDVVEWLNTGNPVALAVHLWLGVQAGNALDKLLPGALGKYALFHGLATIVLVAWAILRLRAVGLAAPPGPVRGALPGTRGRRRRSVGGRPMLWKELFAEPRLRLRSFGRITLGILVPVSFLPALGIIYYWFLGPAGANWREFGVLINLWVRGVGTLVACIMLLGVALRAAGSISGERERQTLDGLVTTPLDPNGILFAKWLGSIAGPRRAWLWLGLIWCVGIFAGGLDFRAIPLLVVVWLVLAAFLASLGLWFSVVSRTSQRALLGTLLATAGLTAGHWLLWVVVLPVVSWLGGSGAAPNRLVDLQAMGLTPPLTLAWLALPAQETGRWISSDWDWARDPILQGLWFWALGAAVLGIRAGARFRAAVAPGANPLHDSKPIARVRGRLLTGTLAVASLLWVAYVGGSGSSADSLRKADAEADRLDPGWRLEELEARRNAVPDERNASLQVPAIPDERTASFKPRWYPGKHWPDAGLDLALQDLAPEVQLNDEQMRQLSLNLEEVETALVQARRLANYPDGRNPITYSKDGLFTLLPYAQRGRTIAGLLTYDVLLRAQENDPDGALLSCRAIVNAGRMLGDEPTTTSMLVRQTCRKLALAKIERSLAQGQPSEPALAALQQLLEDEENQPLLLIGLRGERAMLDRFMGAIETGDANWSLVLQMEQSMRSAMPWADRALLIAGLTVKHQRAALLRYMTRFVEIAKLKVEEHESHMAELAAVGAELPALARALVISPAWTLVPVRMVEANRHNQAVMRSAIGMTAVERYRRAHGGWPETLDALVPAFLSLVPTDPYDGRPLRYRRLPGGVVVYSVGPDGEDNGGTKLLRGKFSLTGKQDSAGTDLGFRLWDVDQRRRAPKPAGTPLASPVADD